MKRGPKIKVTYSLKGWTVLPCPHAAETGTAVCKDVCGVDEPIGRVDCSDYSEFTTRSRFLYKIVMFLYEILFDNIESNVEEEIIK